MSWIASKITIVLLTGLAVPLVASSSLAAAPKNYWLVSSTGQVFAYGKAKAHGSEYGKKYKGEITGIKGTANGGGYWIVTTKTHYGFGDSSRYKYRAGGLKRYTGKTKPKGLHGRIVGYATATIPTSKSEGGDGTKTTTTKTTSTTTTPTVDCSHIAIQTSTLSPGTATDPYSQALTAGGVSGGNWLWTIKTGSLPTGLMLSTGGVVSGTPAPTTAGTLSTFTVRATNSVCTGSPATKGLTLTIGVPPMSITTQTLGAGTYGEPYNQAMTATGGQPDDYEWTATGLPSGLSISTAGVVTGSPSATGTYNGVAITLTDTTGATSPVTAYYAITVSYPPLQITAPTSLANGQATVPYGDVTFAATGGTPMSIPAQYRPADYEWSATGLPTGMTMSVSGVLLGTSASPGSYTVAVTLTDALDTSNSITQDFALAISDAPLGFVTTTLTAIQGQSYTGHVIAQGGQSPYTINLISGSLPSGMTFNNGTITLDSSVASGDYHFMIGVADSQNNPATAQETFNMWVAPSETTPNLSVSGSDANTIWAGYVEQASSAFTSVSGTFTVPTVQLSPSNEVSPWVGIDGYNGSGVVQAGVTALAGNDTASYEAWWETYPTNSPQDQFDANPGDTINVNIWETSSDQWEITLNDLTSGQGFATQATYTGSDLTAEWIVENAAGAPAVGYAATSTFSNLAASQAGTGMLDLSTTGATPSSLTAGGFSVTDYN